MVLDVFVGWAAPVLPPPDDWAGSLPINWTLISLTITTAWL